MAKEIQLNNIFFYATKFETTQNEIGQTQRSFSGAIHTDYINTYHSFNLVIEGLSPSIHSNLLYLVSLNRGYSSTPEDLTLVDDLGNSYQVTIPITGYKYSREEGAEEGYTWELKLAEVIS